MLLGSCAARLVRHAACDVLVVRGDTDVWHTERIVAPTDLSDNGSAAVVAAGELRRSDSDVLTLLHVVDESVPIPSNRVFGLAKPEDVRARVLTQLEAMRDERFGAASTVTCAVRLGESPVQGICNFAREDGCGLVVVATHGRTGLSAMLIGSVAESVVAEAPCPVLVVRNEPAPS
ncbi:MAG: universal stress protein [Myxococcales bacterium]|nr:universal stress protein [Myxococcales bacterium]